MAGAAERRKFFKGVGGFPLPVERFTATLPCPICGGFENAPRGKSVRCWGFKSDGYAHCVREEHSGLLELKPSSSTYAHRLNGSCNCGKQHGAAPRPPGAEAPPRPRTLEATYGYEDADSVLRYQVLKYRYDDDGDKAFAQRRPDMNGGWEWNLQGVERLPYHLPDLLKSPASDWVFVVEGEKDADRLRAAGLVATCNSGGAEKFQPEIAKWFVDRRVVLLADNDAPGTRHAQKVAALLHPIVESVRVADFPGLPQGGDVSDWLDNGNTTDSLLELIAGLPVYSPPPANNGAGPTATPDPELHQTDFGNAQRLIVLHGDNVRYCYPWKSWQKWDGRRWKRDPGGEIKRLAKGTVTDLYAQASLIDDDKLRKTLVRHALASESRTRLEAMVSLAESEPGIAVQPKEMDSDPWALNCLNGTVDLRTGELHPHRREDLNTMLTAAPYEPDARLDLWEDFIADITNHDPDLATFLQQAVGVSLCGVLEEHFFFAYGRRLTGKTTFLTAIGSVLGDYGKTADFETFLLQDRTGGPRPDLARLRGARFVKASEVGQGRSFNEGLLKNLTGGDTLTVRSVYEVEFEYDPVFTLWLSGNDSPRVRHEDDALWRRLLRVPFTHEFNNPDKTIKQRLTDMAYSGAAILRWAVQGCLEWQQAGILKVPDAVQQSTTEYQEESDVLADFLTERCVEDPDAHVGASQFYKEYRQYAEENRIKPRDQLSNTRFGTVMRKRFTKKRQSNQLVYLGVGLLGSETQKGF